MQITPTPPKPPAGVVFDCDMGAGIDDALALCLLYGLDGKNECRAVSVSVSKSNLKSAAFCDVVRSFYLSTTNPRVRAFMQGLPIGLVDNGKMPEDTPMLTVPLARKKPDGMPLYENGIRAMNDTADPRALIRNAISAQHDGNCIVVLAGPATNLAGLLDLPGVPDLIARKVRYLSMMGGAYPEGAAEFNIKGDIPAAKALFAKWPTPIIASGFEIGEAVRYPAASIETDFSWAPEHPLVDAYRAHKTMPYDAETWDLSSVLYAVRPKEGYFQLSEPGTITVGDDGRTTFKAAADGKHRHLISDPAQKDRLIKTYTELISAKPVPKQPRVRPNQQQEQKPAEPKPVTPEVKPAPPPQ